MKINYNYSLYIYLSCFIIPSGFAQSLDYEKANHYLDTRSEVYFSFIADISEIKNLTRVISIDNIKSDTVFAYANSQQFDVFLRLKYPFTILTPPSLLLDKSELITSDILNDWDVYPTYDAYVDMMNAFAENYPDLCQLYEIGTSVNGRKLLCVKISDNVNVKEPEPEFFYTSTMHGDEVTGYMLMLRLIDYLLTNYTTKPELQRLVDSLEIWINPNANPDGTYFSGNHTVSGATRYNANSVDLNRNFPDPEEEEGDHPDDEDWQPETEAMMQFMTEHNFVFSANYHGGSEVMNYPWDTWSKSHPDEDWFEYVSYQYADTVKKYGGSSYFSDVEPGGVTNGYDWYSIAGGRQDYTTYFCNGREITIEVSTVKMPPAASLPSYWDYNKIAMLDYMGQCLKGIHGIVTDSLTGEPLKAKIFILGHDTDSSHVYSDEVNGYFQRLIAPGTYDIKCSAPGYINKVAEDVVLENWTNSLSLNFELIAGTNPVEALEENKIIGPNVWFGTNRQLYIEVQEPQRVNIYLYNLQGIQMTSRVIYTNKGLNNVSFENEKMNEGLYYCKILSDTKVVKTLSIQF